MVMLAKDDPNVILSEAKDHLERVKHRKMILRFAQDDNLEIALVQVVLILGDEMHRLFLVFLGFNEEGARCGVAPCVRENHLDLLFDGFELLMTEARESDAFLEELERVVERELFALEPLNDPLELLERLFEVICSGSGHEVSWGGRI